METWPNPRSFAPRGWTPWEPGVLAVALVLLVASGVFSWWGTTRETSRFSYISFRGLDIGPFMAEEWEIFYFPGSIYRPYRIFSWWDFAAIHPEYAGYGLLAAAWMSLWLAALTLATVAFLARGVPRSRMKGLPTSFQALAALALIASILLVILVLPATVGFPTVSGAEGVFAWGPRLGLFLALSAAALLSITSTVGIVVDRALRGRCWKCHRAASGRMCAYCEARL